ncbi:tyrosine-type recombinase/integrase [Mucilaginibacter xinganensis]|uniref:Site-specific recombinase XerD n=1 Tax=Mucilaginibacter xinganensis TaxID=1234841 RepID=A0A223NXL0_9SPHI|nr:site-specific integrase [Mucilaginibacter xinganensis]ASU34434.1 Site-specific recombinase XerD [Mucilaginibacter xinganensis]
MLRLNYKKATLYDAGGDLKKQWYVKYSYLNPETKKFDRFKVFKEINQENTRASRYDLANAYVVAYNEWLEKGGSPFDILPTATDENKNIIHCIDLFLEFIANGKLRDNTKRKYRIELTVFKGWLESSGFAGYDINEIKKQHIFDFVESIKKRNIKSGKTVNHYLNDIRRFFNHYMDNYDDYLERNPAAKITRDPVEEKGNIAYTDEEFNAIKKHLLIGDETHAPDPYLWLVCQVIYYTGLRNEAELPYLKCGDFDLKNKLFFVEAEIAKNKVRQPVPIYPEFLELLESLNLEQYPGDWYLFGRNDKPGPVRVGNDNFARRFRPVKKHFGFGDEYGLYCFKSKRACDLFDDGATIRDIQVLFRHADPYVTMKYLKSLGRVERGRVYDKGRKI